MEAATKLPPFELQLVHSQQLQPRSFINLKSLRRVAKYGMVGGATFGLDMLLLYVAVEHAQISYPLAVFGTFFLSISVNYALSRHYVFKTTSRSLAEGYAYMLGAACVAAGLTTVLTVMFVQGLEWSLPIGRLSVAALIGTCNYLFNLYVNFRVAGKP